MSEPDFVLALCALPEELRALGRVVARRGGDLRVLPDHGFDAELGGVSVCARRAGAGPLAAAALTSQALAEDRPWRALLGVGVAGALSSALEVGDVLVAREVRSAELASPLRSPWSVTAERSPAVARLGLVWTECHVVVASAQREKICERLADPAWAVVDMESAPWAVAASEKELPWCVVRSVSDVATRDLPSFLDGSLRPGGEVSRGRVAATACLRPGTWPALLRIARGTRIAARRAAEAATDLLERRFWEAPGEGQGS